MGKDYVRSNQSRTDATNKAPVRPCADIAAARPRPHTDTASARMLASHGYEHHGRTRPCTGPHPHARFAHARAQRAEISFNPSSVKYNPSNTHHGREETHVRKVQHHV